MGPQGQAAVMIPFVLDLGVGSETGRAVGGPVADRRTVSVGGMRRRENLHVTDRDLVRIDQVDGPERRVAQNQVRH